MTLISCLKSIDPAPNHALDSTPSNGYYSRQRVSFCSMDGWMDGWIEFLMIIELFFHMISRRRRSKSRFMAGLQFRSGSRLLGSGRGEMFRIGQWTSDRRGFRPTKRRRRGFELLGLQYCGQPAGVEGQPHSDRHV